jgi:hypothetical protein
VESAVLRYIDANLETRESSDADVALWSRTVEALEALLPLEGGRVVVVVVVVSARVV